MGACSAELSALRTIKHPIRASKFALETLESKNRTPFRDSELNRHVRNSGSSFLMPAKSEVPNKKKTGFLSVFSADDEFPKEVSSAYDPLDFKKVTREQKKDLCSINTFQNDYGWYELDGSSFCFFFLFSLKCVPRKKQPEPMRRSNAK